jgi:hypothetical protein
MLETAKTPTEKVRQLQRKLYVCAKQSRTRRFHALYDRIYRSDVLWEAWRRVRSNGGAAGIDGESIQAIEQRGVGAFLTEIQAALQAGQYRPSQVKREGREADHRGTDTRASRLGELFPDGKCRPGVQQNSWSRVCAAGSIGGAGRGQRSERHSPAISYTEWVCTSWWAP